MPGIIGTVAEYASIICNLMWGLLIIIILIAVGLLISVLGRFFQVRKLGLAFKNLSWKGREGSGEVHPFKIWVMAIGATVSVGSIAGASIAIKLGGPGAVFWIWVCGILGMGLKAVEATLSIWSRHVESNSKIEGGVVYYIKRIPKIGPGLAVLFALSTLVAAFGLGNIIQANIFSFSTEYLASIYEFDTSTLRPVIGLILFVTTSLVLIGGLKRIAEVANYIVPFAITWYILFGLTLCIMYAYNLSEAFRLIITGAFSPLAVGGGITGWTVYQAVRYGFLRGFLSNEAGLGSTPNAYAYTESDHPGRQGFYGVLEVFMDTLVICTITAMAVLVTGAYTAKSVGANELYDGIAVTMDAFYRGYGSLSTIILGITLTLLSFTAILAWGFYGEVNWRYFWVKVLKLPEKPMIILWRILWAASLIPASIAGELLESSLQIYTNLALSLMIILNLVAITYFAPTAITLIKEFYYKHNHEKTL